MALVSVLRADLKRGSAGVRRGAGGGSGTAVSHGTSIAEYYPSGRRVCRMSMASRFSCLDMVSVRWVSANGETQCECCTLLEIWPSGGLLHADQPIESDTTLSLCVNGMEFQAIADSYTQDEFGFYVSVALSSTWFPQPYRPEHLIAPPDAGPAAEL